MESKKRDFLITMVNLFDMHKLDFGVRGLLSFKSKPLKKKKILLSVFFLLLSVETLPVSCWFPHLKLFSHLRLGDLVLLLLVL